MTSQSRRRFIGAAAVGSLWLAGCSAAPHASRPAAGTGAATGRGIDESAFVPIGGIDQWVGLRGNDRSNPVILVVHGGPGEAQWPQARHYAAWENGFTVVQWDQRGAGHTFGRHGEQTPEVRLERIVRDGIELSEWLRKKLGKDKLILLGHSWGSIVAVTLAQRRPDLFAAYVGTGQVASWKATVQTQYELLLAKACKDGDAASLTKLEAIGRPDPADTALYFQFTRGLAAAMPTSDRAWLEGLRSATPQSLGISPKDFRDLIGGMTFSASRLRTDQVDADLPTSAPEIDTAVFFIEGRDDVTTPTSAAVAYFDALKAPVKRLVLIDGAGHFAFMTHEAQFLQALTDTVRPVAVARGA